MIWLLKGYYGYKNFGDEVLLLGIILYLFKNYPLDHLFIEAHDTDRLQVRLDRHTSFLGEYYRMITLVGKHTAHQYKRDELFLWWGEVLTDGRPFPYNGWNYLLRYPLTIVSGRYHLLWGLGTPKKRSSNRLWNQLIGHAKSVVTREKKSYQLACLYRKWKHTVLYQDFAEAVFAYYLPKKHKPLSELDQDKKTSQTILLNCNPYIRSHDTKQKLIHTALPFTHCYYFPGERGVDDQFFDELHEALPELVLYDRTTHSLWEICSDMAVCSHALAARLHVLWLAKLLHIPFEPLVYQEKISTFLDSCSGESS